LRSYNLTDSNILIYQSEDGQTKIQTRLEDEELDLVENIKALENTVKMIEEKK
jgi:hypothetical protein